MRKLLSLLLVLGSFNLCAQYFTDVAQESGISFVTDPVSMMGGGAAWFDFDNDGWEDLYITGSTVMDRLYRNLGDGFFENVSMDAGLFETANHNTLGVSVGDYNNDGYRDVFLTTWREINGPAYARNLLYRNEGDGTFTEVGEDAGMIDPSFSVSSAFIDVNLDGYLDIYVANYVATPEFIIEDGQPVGFDHECFPDQLFINNQDGTFSEESETYLTQNEGCALAVVATDYDLDGDSDIMVANDFGEWVIPNKLYTNDYPNPGFVDDSESSGADIGLYGMGIAVGDYDEDQDFDYYITNLGRNVLLNQDGGDFTDVTTDAGVENDGANELLYTSWATFFLDFDNDSWQDLFVCNGHISTIDLLDNHEADPNKLYRNNGDGTFEDVSEISGLDNEQIARGAAWCDYDKDGDIDIAVANIDNTVLLLDDPFMLFQNSADVGNWIALSLTGITCNRDAVGAVVTVHAGERTFLRELTGGGGPHTSQSSSKIHVGLGEIAQVDSVFVQWPGQNLERFDVEINQCTELEQGFGVTISAPINTPQIQVGPNPSKDHLMIRGHNVACFVEVYSSSGVLVFSGMINAVNDNLDVSAFSSGLYSLNIFLDRGVQTITFVKQ